MAIAAVTPVVRCGAAAQLDRRAAEPRSVFFSGAAQFDRGFVALRERAAAHGKPAGCKQAAENGGVNVRQRKPACEASGPFHDEAACPLAGPQLDRAQPGWSMEQSPALLGDERLDPRHLVGLA